MVHHELLPSVYTPVGPGIAAAAAAAAPQGHWEALRKQADMPSSHGLEGAVEPATDGVWEWASGWQQQQPPPAAPMLGPLLLPALYTPGAPCPPVAQAAVKKQPSPHEARLLASARSVAPLPDNKPWHAMLAHCWHTS